MQASPSLPATRLAEDRLGETLLREGALTQRQLDMALQSQTSMRAHGVRLRLGEILVKQGLLTPEQVREFLHLAGKQLLHCTKCGNNYNVTNWSQGREVSCPTCFVALVAAPSSGTLDAAGTQHLMAVVGSPHDTEGKPFGRYRLLQELGHGGMGVVWKAWDTQLKRVVALKQILAMGEEDRERVERFSREARLSAKLRHPHIIAVYDVGEHAGQHYFTSEYVVGQSLDEAMKGTVSPKQMLAWVKDVAEALAYAHEQGVVHRDVKPANILIAGQGQPFVMDFGLAKEVDLATKEGARRATLTASGAVMGTPMYMSPEQASGRTEALGPATDQFSLGVLFYQMLTKRLPFEGMSLGELFVAITQKDPVAPSRINPRIHRDVETICLKSLEKDPARRYASMGELAADLGRYLDGEPIVARPISGPARLWRRAVKHRKVLLPVAAALLVAAAVGAWAIVHSSQSDEKRLEAEAQVDRKEKERKTAAAESARKAEDLRKEKAARDALAISEEVRLLDVKYLYNTQFPMEEYWKAIDDCLVRFDNLCESEPEIAEVWVQRGRMHLMLQEYERAESDLTKALEEDPGHYVARIWRARLYSEWVLSLAYGGLANPDVQRARREEKQNRARSDLRRLKGMEAGYGKRPDDELRLRVLVDAGALIGEGNHPQAVEMLTRAIQERAHEELYALMGLALTGDRDPTRADAAFAEALRLRPRFWKALFDRGVSRHKRGDLDGAIADWDEALRINPGLAEAFLNRGQLRHAKGDLEGAIADCDAALKINPRFAEAFTNRGIARQAKGDLDGAIADYDQALRINPGMAEAFNNRGGARAAKGDLEGAIADCDEALRINPGHAEAFNNRGAARQAKGDLDGAIADFDEALRINPMNAEALYNRGNARQGNGDLHGAIADYDEALKIKPKFAKAFTNRGIARKADGDLDGAIADHDEALRIHPRFAEALNHRGAAREGKGDLDGAIADYDEALRVDPSYAEAFNNRGNARQRKRDLDGAIADYDKAVKLKPGFSQAFTNRGIARQAKGDLDGAIADYGEALKIDPRLAEAFANRGGARQAKGDTTGAVRDWEEALRVAPANWPYRATVDGLIRDARAKLHDAR